VLASVKDVVNKNYIFKLCIERYAMKL